MRRNGENGMQMKTFDLEEQINGNANDVIDLVDRFNANVVYRIEEIVSLHSAFFALCLLGPNYNSSYFFKFKFRTEFYCCFHFCMVLFCSAALFLTR